MSRLLVVTAFTAGPEYGPELVARMHDAIERNLTVPHELRCVSNAPVADQLVRGADAWSLWPNWWFKINLFMPNSWPRDSVILYTDLDNVILGNVDELARVALTVDAGQLIAMHDWKFPEILNSSIMAWKGNSLGWLYDRFVADPVRYMERHPTPPVFSDQGFIQDAFRERGQTWQVFQDHLPLGYFIPKESFQFCEPHRFAHIVTWAHVPKPWRMPYLDQLIQDWSEAC